MNPAHQSPTVASVLLLAVESRAQRLLPWLRVIGEPVRYALDAMAPEELPAESSRWDVIVIDGESTADDALRLRVLQRTARGPHRLCTTLYVCNRLASDTELEHAGTWADDVVLSGWQLGERVRRRVQAIALAPWRRATALRLEAQRRGDERLRIVQPAADESSQAPPVEREGRRRRLDRAQPFVLLDRAARIGGATHELVSAAFHEGRRVGVASVQESAARICASLVDELSVGRRSLSEADIAVMEADYARRDVSPVVAARFDGAEAVLVAIRAELANLARAELAAIELRDARPAYEP